MMARWQVVWEGDKDLARARAEREKVVIEAQTAKVKARITRTQAAADADSWRVREEEKVELRTRIARDLLKMVEEAKGEADPRVALNYLTAVMGESIMREGKGSTWQSLLEQEAARHQVRMVELPAIESPTPSLSPADESAIHPGEPR